MNILKGNLKQLHTLRGTPLSQVVFTAEEGNYYPGQLVILSTQVCTRVFKLRFCRNGQRLKNSVGLTTPPVLAASPRVQIAMPQRRTLKKLVLSDLKRAQTLVRAIAGYHGTIDPQFRIERWLHNFGRCGKWNFCLTTGTLVLANQEQQ